MKDAIKKAREAKEWTQADLAKALGTTQQTVANWEAGAVPRAGQRQKLKEVLGIGVDEEMRKDVIYQNYAEKIDSFVDGRHGDKYKQFVDGVPEKLLNNLDRYVENPMYKARFSYVSDKFICAVQPWFGCDDDVPQSIYQRMVNLAAARNSDHHTRRALLIVVTEPKNTNNMRFQGQYKKIDTLCTLLGIDSMFAPPAAVGQVLELWENGEFDELLDR